MQEYKKNWDKKIITLRSIDLLFYITVIAIFGGILLYGRPIFAINDDLGLYNVLTGAYTKKPNAYVSFMEYPLSWGLAMLYRIWNSVPWYGIFLEGAILTCALVGYRRCTVFLKKCNPQMVWMVALRILFCASWLGMSLIPMLRLQYTVVAAVCGATALFLFVTSDDTNTAVGFIRQNIGTVMLALLAECIRPEMLFMLLGFAGVLWVGRLLYRLFVTKEYWLYIKRYLCVLGIFFVGLAVILLSSHLAYGSVEWREFRKVDRCRVQLFDYYGYPSYDNNIDYFNEYEIDRLSYEAVAGQCLYAGRYLSLEQWEAIVKLAEKSHDDNQSLKDSVAKMMPLLHEWMQNDGIKPINQILVLWYILCIGLVILYKSREGGALLVATILAKMIIWAILIYRGRYPDRIVMSIFWMEFAVLSGIILRVMVDRKEKVKPFGAIVAFLPLLLMIGYWDAEELYRIRHEYSSEQKEIWDGLKEYCYDHKDQLYIFVGGSNTIYYYYDTPFENLNQYENYISVASGHTMNPNTTEKLAGWGITDLMEAIVMDNRIYLIFEEGKFDEQNPLIKYYQERYSNFWYEQVEIFEAGTTIYQVYRFGI